MSAIVIGLIVAVVVLVNICDYQNSPMCKWCSVRHRGRCIWNPRAKGIWANTNDGHFDYNDPNQ